MEVYGGPYLPLTGGTLTGNLTLPAAGALLFLGRAQIQSSADGILTLLNNAGTGFTRLQGGGTTSGFSALNFGVASVQAVLADNSDWVRFEAGLIRSKIDTALVAGGSAAMGFQISSGLIGVYPGSGAPTFSAAKGSLYLRSDGSTTNDRAYVNTNGTTGWTALTTAA